MAGERPQPTPWLMLCSNVQGVGPPEAVPAAQPSSSPQVLEESQHSHALDACPQQPVRKPTLVGAQKVLLREVAHPSIHPTLSILVTHESHPQEKRQWGQCQVSPFVSSSLFVFLVNIIKSHYGLIAKCTQINPQTNRTRDRKEGQEVAKHGLDWGLQHAPLLPVGRAAILIMALQLPAKSWKIPK